MPRNARYEYSPVQEIFLPEPVPFAQYDDTKPKLAEKKPPAPPTRDVEDCVTLKARLRDTVCQVQRGNATIDQVSAAHIAYKRCLNHFASQLVKQQDDAWQQFKKANVSVGIDYTTLTKVRDPRMPLLKEIPTPPSVAAKYRL